LYVPKQTKNGKKTIAIASVLHAKLAAIAKREGYQLHRLAEKWLEEAARKHAA
jgi:predicted HicB family RNase H-like nuclease